MGVPYAEVIGDPVAHSKSPLIHRFWLEKLGLEGDYRPHRMTAGDMRTYFAERRADPDWRGCNVTMPLKRSAMVFPDFISRDVQSARAANCLAWDHDRLFGFNTDISGFAAGLAPLLEPVVKSPRKAELHLGADIVGAGGAARAVAIALETHFPEIAPSFYNRTRDKAEALSTEFRGHYHNGFPLAELRGFPERQGINGSQLVVTILINASPLGMNGYPPLPVALDGYGEHTIVCDLVYDPVETPLLKAARERGLKTMSGLDMLVAQAADAFPLFFGRRAPREHDEELRERLGA